MRRLSLTSALFERWFDWGTGWTDDLANRMSVRAQALGGQRYRFATAGRLSLMWDLKERREPRP